MNLELIDTSQSLGDSLSAIKRNFTCLDIQTCNLSLSAADKWNTMKDVSRFDRYNLATEKSTDFLSNWQNMTNIVANSSAHWFTPVTVLFPDVIVGEVAEEPPVDLTDPSQIEVLYYDLRFEGTATYYAIGKRVSLQKNGPIVTGPACPNCQTSFSDGLGYVDSLLTREDNKLEIMGAAHYTAYEGRRQIGPNLWEGDVVRPRLCGYNTTLTWEGVSANTLQFNASINIPCIENNIPQLKLFLSSGPNMPHGNDKRSIFVSGSTQYEINTPGVYELQYRLGGFYTSGFFTAIITFRLGNPTEDVEGNREIYLPTVKNWLTETSPPEDYPDGYKFLVFVRIFHKNPALHGNPAESIGNFGVLNYINNARTREVECVSFVKKGTEWVTNPAGSDKFPFEIPNLNVNGCGCFGIAQKYNFNCGCIPVPQFYRLTCIGEDTPQDTFAHCTSANLDLDSWQFSTNIVSLQNDPTYQTLSTTPFVPYLIGLSGDNSLSYNPWDYTPLQGNNLVNGEWRGYNFYINDFKRPALDGNYIQRQNSRDLLYQYCYDGSVWSLSAIYEKDPGAPSYDSSDTTTNFFKFEKADLTKLVKACNVEPEILNGCEFCMFIDTHWFAWSINDDDPANNNPYWTLDDINGLSSWYGTDTDRMGRVFGVSLLSAGESYF